MCNTNTRTSTASQLQTAVINLVQLANNNATNKQYQQHWGAFVKVHTQIQAPFTIPATAIMIAMFAASLRQQGLQASTIRTYLSAISNVHKLLGHSDPAATFLVHKTVQGIFNTEAKCTSQRLPITNTELKQLVEAIPYCVSSAYNMRIMLKVLFLLTYHASRRYTHPNEYTL